MRIANDFPEIEVGRNPGPGQVLVKFWPLNDPIVAQPVPGYALRTMAPSEEAQATGKTHTSYETLRTIVNSTIPTKHRRALSPFHGNPGDPYYWLHSQSTRFSYHWISEGCIAQLLKAIASVRTPMVQVLPVVASDVELERLSILANIKLIHRYRQISDRYRQKEKLDPREVEATREALTSTMSRLPVPPGVVDKFIADHPEEPECPPKEYYGLVMAQRELGLMLTDEEWESMSKTRTGYKLKGVNLAEWAAIVEVKPSRISMDDESQRTIQFLARSDRKKFLEAIAKRRPLGALIVSWEEIEAVRKVTPTKRWTDVNPKAVHGLMGDPTLLHTLYNRAMLRFADGYQDNAQRRDLWDEATRMRIAFARIMTERFVRRSFRLETNEWKLDDLTRDLVAKMAIQLISARVAKEKNKLFSSLFDHMHRETGDRDQAMNWAQAMIETAINSRIADTFDDLNWKLVRRGEKPLENPIRR